MNLKKFAFESFSNDFLNVCCKIKTVILWLLYKVAWLLRSTNDKLTSTSKMFGFSAITLLSDDIRENKSWFKLLLFLFLKQNLETIPSLVRTTKVYSSSIPLESIKDFSMFFFLDKVPENSWFKANIEQS